MTRRARAALIAVLLAVFLHAAARVVAADEPSQWLIWACAVAEAAYGRGSDPWILLGCEALDHPNPQG